MSYTAFSDWVVAYKGVSRSPPGQSRLERLPNELLRHILQYVLPHQTPLSVSLYRENRPAPLNDQLRPPNKTDLASCMLISRRLQEVALPLMYEKIFIWRSFHPPPSESPSYRIFRTLSENPSHRRLIRSLRFQHFNDSELKELPTLLPSCNLLRSLSIPVNDFHVDDTTMQMIFNFRHLESLELAGEMCRAYPFQDASQASYISDFEPAFTSPIQRLSVRGLAGNTLRNLVSRCPNLTALEIDHCKFSPGSLSHIPEIAKVTEFHCCDYEELVVEEILDFLTGHPAVKDSLKVLTLLDNPPVISSDWSSTAMTDLLQSLPPSLRCFRATGFHKEHIPFLQELSCQLEEMDTWQYFDMEDIEEIVLGTWYRLECLRYKDIIEDEANYPVERLSSIQHAVEVYRLQQRVDSLSLKRGTGVRRPKLKHLDLTRRGGELRESVLLGPQSLPLEIISLSPESASHYKDSSKFFRRFGWEVKFDDKRLWLERKV